MASTRKKTWTDKRGKERFSWCVEWRNAHGKPKSRCRKDWTHEDAKAFKREIEGRRRAGERTEVEERWTVRSWLADFNERAGTIGIDGGKPVGTARRSQYDWFASRVNFEAGDALLEEITEERVRRLRDSLLSAGLKRSSAREVLNHLKAALADAKRHGHVLANTWGDVRIIADTMPRSVRHQDDEADDDGDDYLAMPTRTQARRLLDTARMRRDNPVETIGWEPDETVTWRKHYQSKGPRGWNKAGQAWRRSYAIVLLAMLTGLRQGEIRGLYKRDIDFQAGLIRVRRAADKQNNIKEPKTRAGRRSVPMPAELAEELCAWLEVAPAGKLVFPTERGNVMNRSNVYHRVWKRLLDHAGMSDCGLSFHSLRHYYASSIIAAGLGPMDVKAMMGHAKIKTTFDLYGGLFPEDDTHRQAAASRATDSLFAS